MLREEEDFILNKQNHHYHHSETFPKKKFTKKGHNSGLDSIRFTIHDFANPKNCVLLNKVLLQVHGDGRRGAVESKEKLCISVNLVDCNSSFI